MTETRWHTLYPELGTGPIAIEPYISPAYFELERERIFRRVWLNVAREDAIRLTTNAQLIQTSSRWWTWSSPSAAPRLSKNASIH